MALDESLYDPRMLAEQRGVNAWNRNVIREKFTLGKRIRQEEDTTEQAGRRKIRRTLSTKLSGAHDAIWADLKARPVRNQSQVEWQDEEQPVSAEEPDQAQQPKHDHTKAQGPTAQLKTSKGLFAGTSIFIHGFPAPKYSILQQHLISHGGLVYKTDDALEESCFTDFMYLVTPYDVPDMQLPPIPEDLSEANRVTEWWVESCLLRNQILNPIEHRSLCPFFSGSIPGRF
jgi:hypothetical protein